jgi:hypothetical protein
VSSVEFHFRLGRKSVRMRRYKLRTATVAVHQQDSWRVATSISSGTVLQVADDFANVFGFVEVEWGGKSVQAFAVDLRGRGELIKATGVAR